VELALHTTEHVNLDAAVETKSRDLVERRVWRDVGRDAARQMLDEDLVRRPAAPGDRGTLGEQRAICAFDAGDD